MARRGFTLYEVLIAIVVLAVGLMAIVRMMAAVLHSTHESADGLTVASHMRGVLRTLETASQDSQGVWDEGTGGRRLLGTYMVLPLEDPTPPGDVFASRNCVVLPRGRDEVFVYPRAGSPSDVAAGNAGGDASAALAAESGYQALSAMRVAYPLPGVEVDAPGADPRIHAYAFALAIKRASVDGTPRDGLYSVTVAFYRHFRVDPDAGARPNEPVEMFSTLLSVGPSGLMPAGTVGAPADGEPWPAAVYRERAQLLGGPR